MAREAPQLAVRVEPDPALAGGAHLLISWYSVSALSPQTRHRAELRKRGNGGFARVSADSGFVAKTAQKDRFFP
jgi:hypothetical protein